MSAKNKVFRPSVLFFLGLFTLLSIIVAFWFNGDTERFGGQSTTVEERISKDVRSVRGSAKKENLPQADLTQLVSDEIAALRILPIPLVSIAKITDSKEEQALLKALTEYQESGLSGDMAPLLKFLERYPESPRRAALLANIATLYRDEGRLTKSFETWQKAWDEGKLSEHPLGRRLADDAFASLAEFAVTLGLREKLVPLLAEVEERELRGSASVRAVLAREALYNMDNETDQSFKCGPFSFFRIRDHLGMEDPAHQVILDETSTYQGTNMSQLKEMAAKMGMAYQVARRQPNAELPTPAVAYWNLGHFSAVVEKSSQGDFVIEDTAFDAPFHMSEEVFDEESSGYFLIAAGELPDGWESVSDEHAANLWGRMSSLRRSPQATGDPNANPCMAGYTVGELNINLLISDTPYFYTPAVGPEVNFFMVYNQREINHPAVFDYSNLGQKWTHGWSSYIEDDPSQPDADVFHYKRGGGGEFYGDFNAASQTFGIHPRSNGVLERLTADSYELVFPDGSKEIYSLPDGTVSGARKVFLTEFADSSGNAVTFTYDGQSRLTKVTDAVGGETLLSYDNVSDPFKITGVSHPVTGRTAEIEYNNEGQLVSIIDMGGIESQFTYGASDFISELITPYGTTEFETYQVDFTRQLTITDPQGDRKRFEYRNYAPGISRYIDPNDWTGPAGTTNENFDRRNTFYWDKKAMKYHEGDYTKARRTHWLYSRNSMYVVSDIPQCKKNPDESTVWYQYEGQSLDYMAGDHGSPISVARRMPDGSIHEISYTYNEFGLTLVVVDPLGRETKYNYASNDKDLLSVQQKNGGSYDTLLTLSGYNASGRPQVFKDGAGQEAHVVYNTFGQMVSVTNALGEVVSGTYQEDALAADYRQLLTVTDQISSNQTHYAYDLAGRIQTIVGVNGDSTVFAYDDLDRLVQKTFHDGSSETYQYDKLDLKSVTGVDGLTTRFLSNSIGQRIRMWDPAGRITQYRWCRCGHLELLIDPMGKVTHWERELNGRVVTKTYPDQSEETYDYDSAGRLLSRTDRAGQSTTYSYNLDDTLSQVQYSGGSSVTPPVSFSYDPFYLRKVSMTDGVGTTQYAYHPVDGVTLGASKLALVDGPLVNDEFTISYDALGRSVSSLLNGVGETRVFDDHGRITSRVTPLGSTQYQYVGSTGRVSSVDYASGQSELFSYHPLGEDLRLQAIENTAPNGDVLSRFTYDYQENGLISSWKRELGSATNTFSLGYDRSHQLVGATLLDENSGVVQASYGFQYDQSGNRLSAQKNEEIRSFAYDNQLNQLSSSGGGGSMRFSGSVDPVAKVSIGGQPAKVDSDGNYEGYAAVQSGLNQIPMVLTDHSGNQETRTIELTVATNQNATYQYDANGNLLSDGERTYSWDAKNQLIRIDYSGTDLRSSEFEYDGLGRRVRIVENQNGAVIDEKWFIWEGLTIRELRDANNQTLRRYFSEGMTVIDPADLSEELYHYTRDHLGSVRELVSEQGAVLVSYDYGLWGERSILSGGAGLVPDFGYTGHYHHAPSGLNLAPYRAYDPEAGRWLSADPLGETGMDGPNLYSYVQNAPVQYIDPTGLFAQSGKLTVAGLILKQGLAGYDAYSTASDLANPCLSTTDKVIVVGGGAVVGFLIPKGGAIVKNTWGRLKKRFGRAPNNAGNTVLFGQRRIGPNFSTKEGVPDFLSGRPVSDVASDLRAGILSPDQLPINAFKGANGEIITLNNRTLGALSEGGFQPTNINLINPTRNELRRLGESPIINSPIPGPSIPVTPTLSDPSVLRVITIPGG